MIANALGEPAQEEGGAEVQARLEWQHHCTAIDCISMLGSEVPVRVVCEIHQDYVVDYGACLHAAELRASIGRVAQHRAVRLALLASILDGWADATQSRWAAWLRKQDLPDDVSAQFEEVLAAVVSFADPVLTGDITSGTWNPTDRSWRP
jgi:hypothetical protein